METNTKTFCITPATDYTEAQFRALRVVNEFRKMGFVNWRSFYPAIKDVYPDAELADVFKKLQQLWYLRNFDLEMIKRLEVIAENIKAE